MDKLYTLVQKTPMAQKVAVLAIFLGLLGGGHYYFIYRDQDKSLA